MFLCTIKDVTIKTEKDVKMQQSEVGTGQSMVAGTVNDEKEDEKEVCNAVV